MLTRIEYENLSAMPSSSDLLGDILCRASLVAQGYCVATSSGYICTSKGVEAMKAYRSDTDIIINMTKVIRKASGRYLKDCFDDAKALYANGVRF